MILLRATKTLAIALTLVDAVLWTYQGHRVCRPPNGARRSGTGDALLA
jgi:hypothetical protein